MPQTRVLTSPRVCEKVHRGGIRFDSPFTALRVPPAALHAGHCYDGCMLNASKDMACFPSCNVEGDMMDTLARVKALNPGGAR